METKTNKTKQARLMFVISITAFLVLGCALFLNPQKEKEIEKEEVLKEEATQPVKKDVIPPIKEKIENLETDAVISDLAELSLNAEITYESNEELPNYYISYIDVTDGDELPEDGSYKVTINMNEKWEEEHNHDHRLVELIDLKGLSEEEARLYMKQIGVESYRIDYVFGDYGDIEIGTVAEQSIPSGQMILPSLSAYNEEVADKILISIYGGEEMPTPIEESETK